ncbi:hypothetical protein NM688_g7945 [Phlebia brevispora]|uniref:Uncharacterized protein n=1 Tax=Phlebia brevispora TaxID=194682 RepID=A0ACC1RZA7_9APHY|nr:hypothetical protein NM688_g7945 [Phlebia brevispora]
MDAESNTRYVFGGNPSGWAGIAKTMRDVDEDKIKDYKEDIDTLLVFTGLFSAVLTAFVIESYQSLSPDPMAPVVTLLGRIANQTQSYTITSNNVTSTFSPATTLEVIFEPPISAVRINQLWFASLTITLITASFAMLVKQWLREYLSMEYTSPHERLRARQFRHPGLATWKVFEIAGLLPLFLQLALGLFFLGMCFFTWSANTGVGTSSIVLVTGWVFLFISATLAPIVSPRCPYKTALLKEIMVKIRRGIRWFLYPPSTRRGMQAVTHVMSLGVAAVGRTPRGHFSARYLIEESDALDRDVDELEILKEVDAFLLDDDLLATTIFDSLTQYNADPSTIIKFVLQALNLRLKGAELAQPLVSSPDLRRLTKRGWMAISNIVASTLLNAFSKPVSAIGPWFEDALYILFSISDHPMTPSAQNAVVRCVRQATASRWMAVLRSSTLALDAAMPYVHDLLDPLQAHMTVLIRSSSLLPSTGLSFVLAMFELQVGPAQLAGPLLHIDLRSLSTPMWMFGSNMIAAIILHTLSNDPHPDATGPWLEDAIKLLLSRSPCPPSTAAMRSLAALCEETAPFQRLERSVYLMASPESPHYQHVLSVLRAVCKEVSSEDGLAWLLRTIVSAVPCSPQCTHRTPQAPLAPLFYEHILRHLEWARHYTLLLADCIERISIDDGSPWQLGTLESFRALLSCPIPLHQLHPVAPSVILRIIVSETWATFSLHDLVTVSERRRALIKPDTAIEFVVSLVSEASDDYCRRFLTLKLIECQAYTSEPPSERFTTVDLNLVRLCVLVTRIYVMAQPDTSLQEVFRNFYSECAKAMERFIQKRYPSVTEREHAETVHLAEKCLSMLDSLEPLPESRSFEDWASGFETGDSVFSDQLFEQLALFVADDVALRFKRVRRLRRSRSTLEKSPSGSAKIIDEPRSQLIHWDGHDGPRTGERSPVLAPGARRDFPR